MNDLQFAEDVMARIRARGGSYHERGYIVVLGAVEFLQSRLDARRHVSAAELAWACRDFALEQFGMLASAVMTHWGIHTTDDFGQIVFMLERRNIEGRNARDIAADLTAAFDRFC